MKKSLPSPASSLPLSLLATFGAGVGVFLSKVLRAQLVATDDFTRMLQAELGLTAGLLTIAFIIGLVHCILLFLSRGRKPAMDGGSR